MDSEMRAQPEYVGHTSQDALTGPRRKQKAAIDVALAAQRQKNEKDNRPRLEPRILLEEPEKSYHAPHRVTDKVVVDSVTSGLLHHC